MKRVLIIDGTNAFYRSYIVNPTIAKNGQPIGGVIGFLKSLQKMIRETKPDQVVVCWDGAGGSQRRRSINKNYKEGRKAVRLNRSNIDLEPGDESQNRIEQMYRLMEYINCLPVAQLMNESTEADDLISIACKEYRDWQKVIVSSDKDFFQLLDDTTILYRPIQKVIFNKKLLMEKFGIHPNNFALVRAIAGDKSDNLPGISGAGIKTVAKRFPFLSDEKDYTTKELVDFCKQVDKPLKFHQNVIKGEKVILDNYRIMQLYNPAISPQARRKVKEIINNYPTTFTKTEMRKMMIQDGFPETSWADLFGACNRISNDS